MYQEKDLENIQNYLKKLFPGEESYIGKLSEVIMMLDARMLELIDAEHEFRKSTIKDPLGDFQQKFFDKYISFLQGYYSTLSATILFIKESKNIKKDHIATGTSARKFLWSCRYVYWSSSTRCNQKYC
jgi:hypothetical protein